MIGRLLKLFFYFLIILIIFAFLPESILNKLKNFLNWEVFLNTLKSGFFKFLLFTKEVTGIDFLKIFQKFTQSLESSLGINFEALIKQIKDFLANFFQKLSDFFR